MTPVTWHNGLDSRSSVGGFGTYRDCAREDTYCLPSLVWTSGVFCTYGKAKPILSLELPDRYQFTASAHSWTGVTLSYVADRLDMDVELRATLPGPLFRMRTKELSLRWAPGSDPRFFRSLDVSAESSLVDTAFHFRPGASLLWEIKTDAERYLLVLSKPAEEVTVLSHRHWGIRFAEAGAQVLLVPLMDEEKSRKIAGYRALWLALVNRPPIVCAERFSIEGSRLKMQAHFEGSEVAPLPPMLGLLELSPGLLQIGSGITLVNTPFGPYRVMPGSFWEAELDLNWTRAAALSTRSVAGPLSSLPEELHYAGDCTWNESQPLDQLLSLRAWAPLLNLLPSDQHAALRARLNVPSAESFRDSLLVIQEPHIKRGWARDKTMWDDRGDACYDPDWYNGLSLSGLSRAAFCADAELAQRARATAKACADERELLTNYYEIYFDWMLSSAWTDPRGLLWLPDCAHNGLEGLLGEERLRRLEGDKAGADRILYLAARTACGLVSSIYHSRWLEKVAPALLRGYQAGDASYQKAPPDERVFGVNGLYLPGQVFPTTPATKAPYIFAGHFPEYAALLRAHGPLSQIRRLVDIWERELPERYVDWCSYYLGEGWEKRHEANNQEARVQAAVFYHLAPDICTRLWVLNQNPDEIEALFQAPLHLSEQLLLRAGVQLGVSDKPQLNQNYDDTRSNP